MTDGTGSFFGYDTGDEDEGLDEAPAQAVDDPFGDPPAYAGADAPGAADAPDSPDTAGAPGDRRPGEWSRARPDQRPIDAAHRLIDAEFERIDAEWARLDAEWDRLDQERARLEQERSRLAAERAALEREQVAAGAVFDQNGAQGGQDWAGREGDSDVQAQLAFILGEVQELRSALMALTQPPDPASVEAARAARRARRAARAARMEQSLRQPDEPLPRPDDGMYE